jgi:hypothetical protein
LGARQNRGLRIGQLPAGVGRSPWHVDGRKINNIASFRITALGGNSSQISDFKGLISKILIREDLEIYLSMSALLFSHLLLILSTFYLSTLFARDQWLRLTKSKPIEISNNFNWLQPLGATY